MKVAAIIQARMNSTRLPGKVLKKILGKTLLEYQIERIKRAKSIDQIIIATTTKESDNPIVELCQQLEIPFYRGSEEDVLRRYYETALTFHIDAVVRLTSDCPLIDPYVIDKIVYYFLENQSHIDYVSNTLTRTYPRGMDTEVMSLEALKMANAHAVEPADREHVTAYLYRHPEQFRLASIHYQTNESQHRWTVDTPEDFQLIQKVITELYLTAPHFTFEDVLKVLKNHPEWSEINAHIEQKKI
ncbi:glycosyltransferase family protein [Paenibacillus alkaliterrae]|uniref:glycosyltransferase family protein n=1 Tax=Paenibacillus alkaliterrae TaxID=320909 RepID=UPI001F1B98A9|nr:glycosyltransferase family protein [Paenibacillus alkaliterrae]MCF2941396.1 glycosyltransferase family protein [Paenibacillus alkaliterrae]